MRKRVFQNLISSVKIVAGEASTEYDESKITKSCIFVKRIKIMGKEAVFTCLKKGRRRLIIVYASKTGFTRKYAEMLSEKLGLTMMDVKELPKVPKESEVLYLGWMKVGKVLGLQKMKGDKVVAVCGSGTGRSAEPSEEEVRMRNDLETTPFFYLCGGCRPLRELKGMDKVML